MQNRLEPAALSFIFKHDCPQCGAIDLSCLVEYAISKMLTHRFPHGRIPCQQIMRTGVSVENFAVQSQR